jgi:hypothetical protein
VFPCLRPLHRFRAAKFRSLGRPPRFVYTFEAHWHREKIFRVAAAALSTRAVLSLRRRST